jgi:shikimate kinase
MIVGPQAVGKMTVGQELSKITKMKFHLKII